jgi:urease accessory protein UreH
MAVSDLGAPLRVMRGFELQDRRLLVQIISAAPGLFAGDRYELDVDVQSGARAVLLTPAATKIHSMPDGGRATQAIRAQVAAGGSLEIYPTLAIPFAGADFAQHVEAAIDGDGRFGWVDPWSFGRIESGERHAFRRISTRLRINREGRPLYRDALELAPGELGPAAMGALEGATHAFAGCWFGPSDPWEPRGGLTEDMILGSLGEDGLYARGLFRDGGSFRRALAQVRNLSASAWGVSEILQTRFAL